MGDIHGHADALERLLAKLGYSETNGYYSHSSRKVIFVGDFIDRGPKILRVLQIAERMVKEGSALAVLGNHELNAIAYQTRECDGSLRFMRPRDEKNFNQHKQTVHQLTSSELAHYINWFRELPLWLDLGGIRVVHACWDETSMKTIREFWKHGQTIDDAFIRRAYHECDELYEAVEIITKGKEAKLPEGIYFIDKDGHRRYSIRLRWYSPTANQTYRNYALQSDPIDCDLPLKFENPDAVLSSPGYSESEPPVFVGHYWLSSVTPEILAPNVACLDYSVAKDGFLCAYQWAGEQKLSNKNFVW
jgi:hypothetical protein